MSRMNGKETHTHTHTTFGAVDMRNGHTYRLYRRLLCGVNQHVALIGKDLLDFVGFEAWLSTFFFDDQFKAYHRNMETFPIV